MTPRQNFAAVQTHHLKDALAQAGYLRPSARSPPEKQEVLSAGLDLRYAAKALHDPIETAAWKRDFDRLHRFAGPLALDREAMNGED